jgi:glycosyltransferase involved in cell wall biosynthesis
MKVLIVTPYFYPHIGGVESYVMNIAIDLKARGWEVVIVTSKTQAEKENISDVKGIKVYRLNTVTKISNTPIGIFWRAKLKRIYKIEEPDVINGHTPVPYMADMAQRAAGKTPFVLTYHNDVVKDGFVYKAMVWIMQGLLIQRTLKNSSRIIATSEFYVSHSLYLRNYISKISIVPPGVDTVLFNTRTQAKEILPDCNGKKVILFVGSISKSQMHKGVDILIEAFAKLRSNEEDNKLVIVGGGDAAPIYKALAVNLGVAQDVIFTGFIENEQLAKFYKRADVLVMASTDINEGFGMVFIEAGAVGTPVIGTNVGGVPFAIKNDETGLLVKPRSVISLAGALRKILHDKQYAEQLGRAGALRASREFNWKLLAEKTDGVLRDALKPDIIQVAGFYPPHLGGMEIVAKNISEKIAADGFKVTVLTSDIDSDQAEVEVVPNLTIKHLKAFEFAHTPIAFGFIPAIFSIRKQSIIHLHLAQAFYPELVLLVSKVRHIPYVLHFHLDLQPSGNLGFLFNFYKKYVLKNVIQNANNVIVFSKEQKAFIHKTYSVPNSRISVIANGVSDVYFGTKKHIAKKSSGQLLYVGRLNAQKRVSILVNMMNMLSKNIHLTIAGNGEDRKELETLIEKLELGDRVHLVGQIDSNELIHYYANADAVVIASENEGMPLALLEAMAAGLPIIGADVPGIRELVADTGVLVRNPDAKSFAKIVSSILADNVKLQKMSEASINTARKYTWSKTVDSLEALYKKVAS